MPTQFQPSEMGRDTSCQPRLLPAPSSSPSHLASSTSRDGASAAPLAACALHTVCVGAELALLLHMAIQQRVSSLQPFWELLGCQI